jgi:hypothetical protein
MISGAFYREFLGQCVWFSSVDAASPFVVCFTFPQELAYARQVFRAPNAGGVTISSNTITGFSVPVRIH